MENLIGHKIAVPHSIYQTIIDIGTNSVLKLTASYHPENDSFTVIDSKSLTTRLGEGLFLTHYIQPAPLKRTIDAINTLADDSKYPITCLATYALRSAKNSQHVLKEIYTQTKQHIRVLSGDEEAFYSFISVAPPKQSALIIDIGGGSTEVVVGNSPSIDSIHNTKFTLQGKSVPIGVVTLMDKFKSSELSQKDREKIESFVTSQLISHLKFHESAPQLVNANPLIFVIGGTGTTLATIDFNKKNTTSFPYFNDSMGHYDLTMEELSDYLNKISELSIEQRRSIKGLPEDRSDTLVMGMIILKSVLNYIDQSKFSVSNRGIRFGFIKGQYLLNPTKS